jgi:anti-anti-sigma regulatory factor
VGTNFAGHVIILRLRNMTAIDSTGLQALENFADRVHESGRQLILFGAREQPEIEEVPMNRGGGTASAGPHT